MTLPESSEIAADSVAWIEARISGTAFSSLSDSVLNPPREIQAPREILPLAESVAVLPLLGQPDGPDAAIVIVRLQPQAGLQDGPVCELPSISWQVKAAAMPAL